MEELLEKSVASRKLELVLVGAFGCVALLLASAGIYGVVAYVAAQRRQEVGIRMALGAARADVTAMMLRKSLGPVFAGLVTGLLLALPLTHFLSSELYEVKATDALTYSTASLVMAAIAGCAAYFPSRKAARTDPMLVLRQE
jgi:ABC-type antimicrobial peptide transport system permease subunit